MSTSTPPPFTQISLSRHPPSSPAPKVLIITLNRPARHNAATYNMLNELVRAFAIATADDRVKAIVLTGAGRTFCVGTDLTVGFGAEVSDKSDPKRAREFRDLGGRVSLAIHSCPKPTIVALNGSAAGIGITMTLPAAIRVACASARICFPFARRGLTMEACSSFFLPRLVGHARAIHLVVTGATYQASDPLVAGLFSELLQTPEATVARALAIAEDVAANTSVVATKLMRDMMVYGPDTPEAAHVLDSAVFLSVVGSKDNREGVQSFLEKREPVFEDTMKASTPGFWPWWKDGAEFSVLGGEAKGRSNGKL